MRRVYPAPFFMFYVYCLKSESYDENYIGSTNDLRRRLNEHNEGMEVSGRRYRPWELVYYEAYLSEEDARERERKLKNHGNAMKQLKKRICRSLKNIQGLPSTIFENGARLSSTNFKNGAGFTILELIAVIGIIVLLTGIGIPAYNSWRNRARIEKARATIAKIGIVLEMYKSDNGMYPQAGADLNNPANPLLRGFLAAYMDFRREDMGTADNTYNPNGNVLLDPWGRYYTVIVDNVFNQQNPPVDFAHNRSTFYVYSRGPDGARGDCNPNLNNPNDVDNDNVDNYKPT